MATAQDKLIVRIDSDVKASAKMFFRTHGFTLSTGISALLRDAIERGEMPANGSNDSSTPRRASTIEELKQMKVDYDTGRIEATPWENVKRELDAIQN